MRFENQKVNSQDLDREDCVEERTEVKSNLCCRDPSLVNLLYYNTKIKALYYLSCK